MEELTEEELEKIPIENWEAFIKIEFGDEIVSHKHLIFGDDAPNGFLQFKGQTLNLHSVGIYVDCKFDISEEQYYKICDGFYNKELDLFETNKLEIIEFMDWYLGTLINIHNAVKRKNDDKFLFEFDNFNPNLNLSQLILITTKIVELAEDDDDVFIKYSNIFDDSLTYFMTGEIKTIYERVITFIRWYNENQEMDI